MSHKGNESDRVHAKTVLEFDEVEMSSSSTLVSEVRTEAAEEVVVVSVADESMLESPEFETIPEKNGNLVFHDVVVSDVDDDDSHHWNKSENMDLPVVFPVISDEVKHGLSSGELFNGLVHTHSDEHHAEFKPSTLQLSCIAGDKSDTAQDEVRRSETDFRVDADPEGKNGSFKTSTRADLYTLFEDSKFILTSSEHLTSVSSNGYSAAPSTGLFGSDHF